MHEIKIPQQDFVLKRLGGLCAREGIFAGHYRVTTFEIESSRNRLCYI